MTRNVIYCAVLLSLLACQRQDTDDVLKPDLGVPPTIESTPEPTVTEEMKADEREAQQAIQDSENEFEYFYRERPGQQHLTPGEWIEENGSKICVGFLTRVADEDFCASTIPSDWEPFDFNGHTYYVQPLSEDVEGS